MTERKGENKIWGVVGLTPEGTKKYGWVRVADPPDEDGPPNFPDNNSLLKDKPNSRRYEVAITFVGMSVRDD